MGTKRIIVTAWGSFGDFNPHAALALGLRDRGHDAVFAGPEFYRAKVEGFGLPFLPVRPDLPDWRNPGIMARMNDSRRGTERVVRELILPALADAYADLHAAATGADAIVSSLLATAGRLVAEARGIGWVSTALQPSVFLSAEDPPALEVLPGIVPLLRVLRPGARRVLMRQLMKAADPWAAPWHAFRAELGLPPARDNPFLRGQHAPSLALALFSPILAAPQRDWPPQSVATGFPFDPRVDGTTLPPELAAFLDAGEPPIVFTLGSTAVLEPGGFYEQSIAAARALGRRAVLLVGPAAAHGIVHRGPDMIAVEQAPHRALFPQAAAVVFHGGIGTLSQAMLAGVPSLIVPHAHDQPDNAMRAARLGIALVVRAHRYRADRAAGNLDRLLGEPAWRERATEVAERIQAEDGVGRACESIERVLDGR